MWFSRIQDLLLESGPHVIVAAGEEWGFSYILDSLKHSGYTVLFVEFDPADADNSIRQGNRLSDAVYSALGTRLFGLGVPVHYGLSFLRQSQSYLSPTICVIKHSEFGKPSRDGLVELASSDFRVVELHDPSSSFGVDDEVPVLTNHDLRVRPAEAKDMFSNHLSTSEVEALLSKTSGAYSEFLQSANRELSLPPPDRPQLGVLQTLTSGEHRGPALLEYLIREKRWIEAFELAVSTSRIQEAIEIIASAGEAYFEAGLFSPFWAQLRALPERVFYEDLPAFWLFSTAIAVDKQDEVKDFLWRQLNKGSMPKLRALMACSNTTSSSLKEAETAFSQEKSVMTVRAMAHCLASFGRPNEALRITLDSLPEIEKTATPRELANYSYTISRNLLFLGRYSAAHEWASWGMRIYEEARLKEELLRLALVSAKAYYCLLLGNVPAARSALASVSLDMDLAGVPTMDALFSTAGDVALVSGDYSRAFELYNLNYLEARREQIGYYLADVVGVQIMMGRVDDATTIARDGHTLAIGTHERNVALTKLAMGIALSFKGAREARDLLQSCIAYFSNSNDSVSLSRAALHLAQYFWRDGQRDRALQVILDAREHIGELGQSGWELLGLPNESVAQLWNEYYRNRSAVRLHFLGRRLLRTDATEHQLSLRNAEILALMAAEPKGLTGEQLLLQLYGEDGVLSTLKASVSKLRQLVPISSRPYLLDTRYEADHVGIQRLIADGRLSEALDMYEGPLLPGSEAPGVQRLREIISESLRQAVLNSGDRSLMLKYLDQVPDDLEALETLQSSLGPEDPHYSAVVARVAQLRKEWALE